MGKKTKINILPADGCLNNSNVLQDKKETNPEQQKSAGKEERLNALFKILRDEAHDLNQPLMSLQGNIDLMKLSLNKPEKLVTCMKRVEITGDTMAYTVKKIQEICHSISQYPYHDTLNVPQLKT